MSIDRPINSHHITTKLSPIAEIKSDKKHRVSRNYAFSNFRLETSPDDPHFNGAYKYKPVRALKDIRSKSNSIHSILSRSRVYQRDSSPIKTKSCFNNSSVSTLPTISRSRYSTSRFDSVSSLSHCRRMHSESMLEKDDNLKDWSKMSTFRDKDKQDQGEFMQYKSIPVIRSKRKLDKLNINRMSISTNKADEIHTKIISLVKSLYNTRNNTTLISKLRTIRKLEELVIKSEIKEEQKLILTRLVEYVKLNLTSQQNNIFLNDQSFIDRVNNPIRITEDINNYDSNYLKKCKNIFVHQDNRQITHYNNREYYFRQFKLNNLDIFKEKDEEYNLDILDALMNETVRCLLDVISW